MRKAVILQNIFLLRSSSLQMILYNIGWFFEMYVSCVFLHVCYLFPTRHY